MLEVVDSLLGENWITFIMPGMNMAFKRLSMRKIHRVLRPKPMSRCAMPPHASLKDDARRGARGALPTFVRRALGYFPTGESVRWNPETRRFENVPWPLQSETKERVPQDATRVEPEDNADGRLREIWHHARVAGYEVKEIREFAADCGRPTSGPMASQNAGVRPARGRRAHTHQRMAGNRTSKAQ